MRSRPSSDDSAAEVTRRRLEALIAELAVARGEVPPPSEPTAARRPVAEPTAAPRAVAVPTGAPTTPGRHARRPVATRRRLAGWAEDRLPGALRGRAHLGSAQFGVVALVVAMGLVIGAWWLVASAGSSSGAGEVAPPRPIVATASASTSPTGPPTPTTDGGAAGPSDQIVVDVVGKVRRPGITVLPVGSRVVDAVRAAGGMRPGVEPGTVNLARVLTDGEQVVIGLPQAGNFPSGGSAPPGPGSPAGALVNLNTADQATLETLPGVGPVTAAAILEWRAQNGGFTSVDELLEVSGIGDAILYW